METKKKAVIQVKDLHKSFGSNQVLNGFSMELFEGENLVVMGKSGSGKSVLIKCIIGLEVPDSGAIMIMEHDISTLKQKQMDELRTEIGFLFQGSALYDSMSVRENLEFPLRRHTQKFGEINDTTPMVTEALESVGLAHAIDLMPNELSGGMKRRIALARTLILKPKMKSIQMKYKTSSIIITHDIDCARVICNRMILLVDGINYAEGTFEELTNLKEEKVQAFFK
ncbi:ABC transporter ATP-binding protein [Flavobacterium sp.]|uniref:ABC transporter ATP-binding protein n=1 Tax=Flavobacterium sp. TaxID=239 RepID=UPI0037C03C41